MDTKPTVTDFLKLLAAYGAASFQAGYTESQALRLKHRRYRNEARRLKWELETMWEEMRRG